MAVAGEVAGIIIYKILDTYEQANPFDLVAATNEQPNICGKSAKWLIRDNITKSTATQLTKL